MKGKLKSFSIYTKEHRFESYTHATILCYNLTQINEFTVMADDVQIFFDNPIKEIRHNDN